MIRLGRLSALAAVLLAACTGRAPAPPMETVRLSHGPFEIVAQGRRVSTGAFPNTSGNPFATMEVTAFSVRWRDREIEVPQVGNRFWRVLRVMDAPQPALLVSTTDFHLVTEEQGQLKFTRYGQPSTNMAMLQWLDSEAGQPGPQMLYGIEKVFPERGTELSGGRWLLVSHHTVLDVRTLKAWPVRPWVSDTPTQQGFNAGSIAARVFSPDRLQYAAPGSANVNDAQGRRADALVTVDIASGEAYALKLDRARMRYADYEDITRAWVEHYFEWRPQPSGALRLAPRAGARPLPWRGRRVSFGDRHEYRVYRIAPEFVDVVRRLAVERLGASVAPDWIDPKRPPDGMTLKVPGCDHVIALSASRDHVGVFSPQANAAPWVRCQDTVTRLGELVDAELASGRHDALLRFD